MTPSDDQLVRDRLVGLRDLAEPTDAVWASIADRAAGPVLDVDQPRPRRGRWLAAAAVVLVVAGGAAVLANQGRSDPEPLRTAGTGSSTTAAPARAGELTGVVTVVQDEGGPVRMCASGRLWAGDGGACEGPELRGWDWAAVGGGTSEQAGATSGRYTVSGHFDGDAFVVTSAAAATGGSDPEATGPPPCTATASGSAPTTNDGFDAMLAAAKALPSYAGEWYSRDAGAPATPFDPSAGTETVAVAADPATVRPQLEALWGGKLCIVQVERSLAQLEAVQTGLDAFAAAHGIDMTGISIDPETNSVQVGVFVEDPAVQAAADAEFGPGAVTITGNLHPM